MKHSHLHRRACFFLTAWLAISGAASAADWDERLARAFSARLKEIDRELVTLVPELDGLPNIPVDDQGGTGGFASIHSQASPQQTPYTIEVRWGAQNGGLQPVESLALVPARRYDARGLDAHYGLADSFTVELIDADGKTLAIVADERGARAHPVRRGHPFVYQIDPPVTAAGARISARLLPEGGDGDEGHIHAWAELFAFAPGGRNLAFGGSVRATGGSSPPSPWHWSADFLVDGQTPLGLPEIPVDDHRNVGWLSKGRADAAESASLSIDLGAVMEIDGLRLLPARRPTSDLPSGFGFPTHIEISVAEGTAPAEGAGWRVVADRNFRNPGHNPVWISLDPPQQARHVRVNAVELWKAFESYPAFFALSELEVFSAGENVALGKAVRSADGMPNLIAPGGRYWSSAALIDGHGPDGRLIPTQEWMALLDRRLVLETRIHELHGQADAMIRDWRNGALVLFALLGIAGAIAIIALPLRFRAQSRRQLLAVRERIAGDLHDEVGSNLGSIQMFADLAEGRAGPSEELKRIQRIAAETVSAVRDIVWLLRPGGDHRIGTVEHLRETASIMVDSLDWKFHANEASWIVELTDESNRHLFLFFREALHNILRHANATTVDIRVETDEHAVTLEIEDDGAGIPPEKLARPATFRALRQRAEALRAGFDVQTAAGEGTTLKLHMPLRRKCSVQ
jgi:signal transduction histidine kinase